MKPIILPILALAAFSAMLHAAAPPPPEFSFTESGVLQIESLNVQASYRDPSWNTKEQQHAQNPVVRRQSATRQTFSGQLGDFQLTQQVDTFSGRHCHVSFALDAPSPVRVNSIYWGFPVFIGLAEDNEIRIDGKRIRFPKQLGKSFPQVHHDVGMLELPLDNGFFQCRFERPAKVRIEDLRTWNIQAFDVRIFFSPDSGGVTSAKLEADVRYVPYQAEPLPLAGGASSRGRRDIRFRHIRFSCGEPRALDRAHPVAEVNLPPGSRTLFLLHAADAPTGGMAAQLECLKTDGLTETFPIIAGSQVGSAGAGSAPSAAYEIEEQGDAHWYVAAFPLPEQTRTVRIRHAQSEGDGKYWLLGAACSEQAIPLRASNGDFTLKNGKDWRRMTVKLDVVAGSALDLSAFTVDAPAGKHGRVVVRDGHFQFAGRPGTPVRFHGANLCFSSCFPTREQAEIIARRLARQGFNAVRFHHFDQLLVKKLPNDSGVIDPAQLDRMEYLVSALKNAGIYITLDLYTIRTSMPGELAAFPEGLRKYDPLNHKIAMLLYPEARARFKAFVTSLLTHRNPYTGMTWAEDPVFSHISVLNENNPRHLYDRTIPQIKRELRRQTEEYCLANKLPLTDFSRRDREMEVLMIRYGEYWDEITAFLRGIGLNAPLTEQNFCSYPYLLDQRRNYDYVDNHKYWDHPNFGGKQWGLPMYFLGESALRHRAPVPKWLGSSRVFGKPYTVTELDFCYPNSCRAEGSLLYFAIGALQDWDGMYHYDYADGLGRMFPQDRQQLRIFDICNDMSRLIPARLGTVLFLRGDVSAAKTAYPVAVDTSSPGASATRFPEPAEDLIFRGLTGSLLARNGVLVDPLPEGTRAIFDLDHTLKNPPVPRIDDSRTDAQIQSDTGQILVDFSRHAFSVVTPRTEAAAFPAGDGFSGKVLTAHSRKAFGVVGAIALDDAPLSQSARILILHVTDCKQEDSLFDSPRQTILKKYGDLRHVLGQHGICDLTLALPPRNWRLFALDFDGTRLGEVAFQRQDGLIRFSADTFHVDGHVVFAYELTAAPTP